MKHDFSPTDTKQRVKDVDLTERTVSSSPTTENGLISIAAVIAADALFYDQPLGWTLGLYGMLLLGAVLRQDRGRLLKTCPGILISIGTAGLALSLLYQPGITGVMLSMVGLITLGLTSRCGWTRDAWLWGDRWLRFIFSGWRQILLDAQETLKDKSVVPPGWKATAKTAITFGPVALLALIFIGLFAAANPLIASWLETFGQWVREIIDAIQVPRFSRLMIWLVVATLCWTLLRYRPMGRFLKIPAMNDTVLRVEAFFLNARTIVTGLAVFNLIFGLQNLLDIGYLWGGAELPEGMTYAEYAQRGAYPLVATALLAAAFMLVTFRPAADAGHSRLARGLVYLWIAQNIFLTASAGWRLNLYVEVYSLTKLRVAAAVWMLLVALGLVWICVRILAKRSNLWLVNVNVLTLFAVLYACAFINFSGFISWYNCRHCYEVTGRGSNLDLNYLRSLGPEAIPALQWVISEAQNDPKFTDRTETTLDALKDALNNELRNWRGWTWRRHKLMQAVTDTK